MARIIFDDGILNDPDFNRFFLRKHSFREAIGSWMEALILQGQLQSSNHGLIPVIAWKRANIDPDLIYCGLATQLAHGIELKNLHQSEVPKKALSEAKVAALRKARESKALKRSENSLNSDALKRSERPLNSEQKISENSLNSDRFSPPVPPKEEKKEEREEKSSFSEGSENSEFRESLSLPQQIRMAWDCWNGTLGEYGIMITGISPRDEQTLLQAIRMNGFENVMLAIEGKRYEPKFPGYDPGTNLSLHKLFAADKRGNYSWDKFKNLALKNKQVKSNRMTEEEIDAQAKGRRK